MNNLDDWKKGIENTWSEISTHTNEKFFQSMSKRVPHIIDFKGFPHDLLKKCFRSFSKQISRGNL